MDVQKSYSKPIRVLQVIGVMNRGGAETMIMNIYRTIDREKVQFDFVENSFEEAVFDEEIKVLGGKIYRCPHFNGKNYFQYKLWWKKFWNEHASEYQIVHGHIGSTASIYLDIAQKHGVYTIAHSHNTNGKNDFKQMAYNLLSLKTRYVSDSLFACSVQAGIDRYGKMFKKKEGIVLNNAIDTNLYEYNEGIRHIIRREIGIEEDVCLIGNVSRFMTQKNHTFLLDIFAEYLKINGNSKLLLVGDGELRTEIEEKINNLGIQDHTILTGVRSDVNRIMQAIDVFVMPSLYEGLPVTMVEAQTSGVKCLISDKVPDECILIKNLVSIMKLANTPKEWAECIDKIHLYTRKNDVEIIKKAGFDIYTSSKWLEEYYCEKAN